MLNSQYDFVPRYFRLALANVLSNIMVPLASLVSVIFLGHPWVAALSLRLYNGNHFSIRQIEAVVRDSIPRCGIIAIYWDFNPYLVGIVQVPSGFL
jgi:hypothetical protein